ncbi:MAG: Multidrug resistance protein MdtA [Calditrichaeota bacterium]|nr:Multidrug resistance protein MdtA [Calditrichota bacterium]
MKKIIGFIVGAVIVVALVLGIVRSRESEEVLSIANIQEEEGVPVLAETVQRRDVQVVRNYYGTIQAVDQTLVTAKLMERIEKFLVEEGDRVRAGDALVRFDTTASQAAVTQARLQMENAKRDYERMKRLLDEGAISRQQLDQAELGYEVARENYETARRSVVLHAPITGYVARVEFDEGDVAHPGDPVIKLVDDRRFEVAFEITQEDRPLLGAGQNVRVTLGDGRRIDGHVSRISLAADAVQRMFTVYANVERREGLYPGVLATVDVVVEQALDVVAVPREAILMRNGDRVVFVIENDTLATSRTVQRGLVGADFVEILHGVSAGERIANYGHGSLQDGMKVNIVEEKGAAAL